MIFNLNEFYPDIIPHKKTQMLDVLKANKTAAIFYTQEPEWESGKLATVLLNIKKLKSDIPGAKVLFVLNSWYKHQNINFKEYDVQVVYIDLWIRHVYRELFVHNTCKVREKWEYNPDNSYLMLIGKPNKPHRIPLLYKLDKRNLIKNNTLYSLRVTEDPTVRKRIDYLLSKYLTDEKTGMEYAKSMEKEIDVVYNRDSTEPFHYSGIPFNKEIFESTNFQVVIETSESLSPPLISEKTWIAIANKMPFIVVGSPKTCEYLENLGFRTFREYMKHPLYDETELNLDLVVDNIEHLELYLHTYVDRVKADINHNFTHLEKLYSTNYKEVNKLLNDVGIDIAAADFYLTGYDNWKPTQLK